MKKLPNFYAGKRLIGADQEPFIIAEMSGNHNGSIEQAKAIVRAAAETGVDCIKFQTYTADTITLDSWKDDFVINDEASLWNGRQLHELYAEAHTPWEWHEELFELAKELDIIAFSSPFDETAVDFLEELGAPLYKIASFEVTHLPLIKKVAQTGKPIIMSTGLASEEEIYEAIATAKATGNEQIVILKCTSNYPADASDANLATMLDMREKFGVQVGLSDHTLGIGASVAAVTMGASVVEKHFIIDRSKGGVDSAFSLEPDEMKALKVETTRAWNAVGAVHYGGMPSEENSKRYRQSIFPKKTINAGDVFSAENLKICRPGTSLAPKNWDALIGKTSPRNLEIGDRLNEEDLA